MPCNVWTWIFTNTNYLFVGLTPTFPTYFTETCFWDILLNYPHTNNLSWQPNLTRGGSDYVGKRTVLIFCFRISSIKLIDHVVDVLVMVCQELIILKIMWQLFLLFFVHPICMIQGRLNNRNTNLYDQVQSWINSSLKHKLNIITSLKLRLFIGLH